MTSRPVKTRLGLCAAAAGASLAALAASAPPAAQAPAAAPSCSIQTTERVVAVGDVHGGYERLLAILREAGLIDARRRWRGGRAILVQTGDLLDRGPDSREILDLLRRLERDAARAGGRVHALLGNHEVGRMLGDYRYVSEAEYAAFRLADSQALREQLYQILAGDRRAQASAAGAEFDERAFREQFLAEIPLGRIEMQQAFAPTGEYGQWLRGHDAMVVINGIAFLHGGVSPDVAPLGCAGINAGVRAEIDTVSLGDPGVLETLVAGPAGPLWYRGYFETPPLAPEQVDAILAQLGVRALVVGHTVATDFRIAAHYGGRVFQIDTGLLGGDIYKGGVPSAIEFNRGAVTAIYEGRREPLATLDASVVQHRGFAFGRDARPDQRQNRVAPREQRADLSVAHVAADPLLQILELQPFDSGEQRAREHRE